MTSGASRAAAAARPRTMPIPRSRPRWRMGRRVLAAFPNRSGSLSSASSRCIPPIAADGVAADPTLALSAISRDAKGPVRDSGSASLACLPGAVGAEGPTIGAPADARFRGPIPAARFPSRCRSASTSFMSRRCAPPTPWHLPDVGFASSLMAPTAVGRALLSLHRGKARSYVAR